MRAFDEAAALGRVPSLPIVRAPLNFQPEVRRVADQACVSNVRNTLSGVLLVADFPILRRSSRITIYDKVRHIGFSEMPRTSATVTVSLPPDMVAELDRVQKIEHRTRSELVREALRHYIRMASDRAVKERIAALPEVEPDADEVAAIQAGRREFRARNTKRARHALVDRSQRRRAKRP